MLRDSGNPYEKLLKIRHLQEDACRAALAALVSKRETLEQRRDELRAIRRSAYPVYPAAGGRLRGLDLVIWQERDSALKVVEENLGREMDSIRVMEQGQQAELFEAVKRRKAVEKLDARWKAKTAGEEKRRKRRALDQAYLLSRRGIGGA